MTDDRWFKSSSGEFHYLDWGGSGPLAHMAHATGFCARVYTPLAARLNSRLRLVGMDDRGHGLTRVPADPKKLRSWDVFAGDLEKFFEYLGEPVVAMGHSRGAVASLMLAVKRPDLVRALILVDPTILPFSWMWWWYLAKLTGQGRRVPIAANAARRRDIWPDRNAVFRAWKGKGPFAAWKDGFLDGYIQDGLVEQDGGQVRLSCRPAWESRCFAVCNHDVWRYVPKPACPVMLIYGRNSDTFLPAARARYQRQAPETVMVGIEGAGHFVPMEKPEDTVAAITGFLKDQGILPKP